MSVSDEELLGRLAAIELALAKTLHWASRSQYGSRWSKDAIPEADIAVAELATALSGEAFTAAEQALRRIYDRSRLAAPAG